MIQEYVDRFIASRSKIEATLAQKHPENYSEIVRFVIEYATKRDASGEVEYEHPDPERIHLIDDGEWQGTLLFVIAAKGYQPSFYWFVKVDYGSCSGCDTLEGIRGYSDEKPSAEQVADYWTLALHVVQGLTPMQEDEDVEGDARRALRVLVAASDLEDVESVFQTLRENGEELPAAVLYGVRASVDSEIERYRG